MTGRAARLAVSPGVRLVSFSNGARQGAFVKQRVDRFGMDNVLGLSSGKLCQKTVAAANRGPARDVRAAS